MQKFLEKTVNLDPLLRSEWGSGFAKTAAAGEAVRWANSFFDDSLQRNGRCPIHPIEICSRL